MVQVGEWQSLDPDDSRCLLHSCEQSSANRMKIGTDSLEDVLPIEHYLFHFHQAIYLSWHGMQKKKWSVPPHFVLPLPRKTFSCLRFHCNTRYVHPPINTTSHVQPNVSQNNFWAPANGLPPVSLASLSGWFLAASSCKRVKRSSQSQWFPVS